MNLKGRVAIVTGSSQGIGRGVALKLSEEGASIVVNGTNTKLIDETVSIIEDSGGSAIGVAADISKKIDVDRMMEATIKKYGKLDILVNNAGNHRDAMLEKMTEQEWDDCLAVHLKGMFLCTQAVTRYMRKNKYGRIITISSAGGFFGNIGMVNYVTSKAGQFGFTISAAKELAMWARKEGCNITCNCITPGYNVTKMTEPIPEKVNKRLLAAIPMGRVADTKEEIGSVIAFLASEEASYITGAIIGAGGGGHLGLPHMY
ncbi:SDR family NAD(P)-dependent oxidoreductase [Thermodesulfobacteriota bacterium]